MGMIFLYFCHANSWKIKSKKVYDPCRRFRTFNCFIDQLSLQLMGSYRSSVHHRESREKEQPQLCIIPKKPRRLEVAMYVVCAYKYNKYVKDHPGITTKYLPVRKVKTTFWCGYFRHYLCNLHLLDRLAS